MKFTRNEIEEITDYDAYIYLYIFNTKHPLNKALIHMIMIIIMT